MIGILDLNLGNLKSVYNAIYEIGYDPVIINSSEKFDDLTHLIIPGVGTYPAAMQCFNDLKLQEPIENYIQSKRPLLGICLGMQILSERGEELENTLGIGLIQGSVTKFSSTIHLRLPHVGWNSVNFIQKHPLFFNIKNNKDFYFVHSFHFNCENSKNVYATCSYGYDFACIVGKNNIIGVQFHPEKSQKNGLKFLENFCEWDGL